ncbi:MAG: 3-oxoadipate enol-lactonase [Hyphomicrobiales bacterium]
MPHIHANGIDIHYQFDGPETAPVLLMSNSLGTNLGMWDDQISAFTPEFHILRYDKRGHGQTSAPEGEYTLDQLGGDVLALLDTLQLEKVYFCGLSIGGMTGQWLGRNAADRLHKLVLSNTSAHMAPKDMWDERIKAVLKGGMEPMVDTVTSRWFTPEFIANEPERVAKVQEMILTTPPAGYAGCSAAIRDMDQRDGISNITVPTLVISGDKDPATPPKHGRLIADTIAGARYVEIAGAAHLANIEQTETFNEAVAGFLTG